MRLSHCKHAARRIFSSLLVHAQIAVVIGGAVVVRASSALAAESGSGRRFTAEQKSFWAFQPLQDRALPTVQTTSWPTSPIDRFILSRLEAAGLSPSPPAGKRTLLRRVTYDLTGLPPTMDEVDAFLTDASPEAFARVVDRLLDSPRYGERWGRHWLDAVRYAESAAHDGNNAYLHAWRYRDYVIDAFNRNTPYDTFIIEQLAGDLLPKTGDVEADYGHVAATGFLQVGTKPVVMRDKRQMLLDIADEQLHATGVAFLGLTLGCARCHDHKFDPIPTADYYGLAGIFMSTHVMADDKPDSMWLEYEIPAPDGTAAKVMAVRDLTEPVTLRVHMRGNYRTLGDPAPKRFLQIIAGGNHAPIETAGSGRLELARWIASPGNPLTARVMVNRIWQHHFGTGLVATSDNFGVQGAPPSHPDLLDWLALRFIESRWSVKAMHRLMLLSSTYRQSAADRPDAARADPDNRLLSHMPRRRLEGEAIRDTILHVSETLDLTMHGTLFTEGYTPVDASRELYTVDISGKPTYRPYEAPRRSVYLPVIRNSLAPMLRLFDAANEHDPTCRRAETTVAPQSLFLMNSRFVRDAALAAAAGLATGSGIDHDRRLDVAHRTILGRLPTPSERREGKAFLESYAAALENDPALLAAARAQLTVDNDAYEKAIGSTDGLLAYYRCAEPDPGGQTARAVNAGPAPYADGTYINGAMFRQPGALAREGIEDVAVRLDGERQRIQVDNPSMFDATKNAMTVEYWVRPTDVRVAMIIGRDDLGGGTRLWKSGTMPNAVDGKQQNTIFYEFFGQGGLHTAAEAGYVAPVDTWTHIAFTYGNGARRLYINGRKMHEATVTGPVPNGSVPLTIGSRYDDHEWFQGGIDEIAIYGRALSAGTIAEHHALAEGGDLYKTATPRLLAWRSYCQALMCTNEFVYLD